MEEKRFGKGEVIFREWSLGRTMYELKSGKVGIFANYGEENEKKLTELEPGKLFGEMAVIEVYPRSATAVALENSAALEISTEDIQEYFRGKPDKLLGIMRNLSHRTRELTDEYMDACLTLREMEQSRKDRDGRSSGLRAKIKKFMSEFAAAQRTLATMGLDCYHYYY